LTKDFTDALHERCHTSLAERRIRGTGYIGHDLVDNIGSTGSGEGLFGQTKLTFTSGIIVAVYTLLGAPAKNITTGSWRKPCTSVCRMSAH
jgi:hypothetical protein